ncbi:MAG: hypothetical protein JSW34_11305 [Candidatus Zixiibacteriota bacterium]|nr:MAG: hypothetical protein JSW34_11305 [candidate division Zixibacteria bacterium]
MSFFKGSTDFTDPDKNPLPAEEDAVLDKLAHKAVDKGMSVPAILFLESVKPLNFIGSQVMVFFEPVIQTVFNFRDYNTIRSALEKRESIEILLLKIEKYDAVALARQKRIKKYMKGVKKNWKWYQLYLGLFCPRVKIPDEVLNPPEKKPKDSPGSPR